MKATSNHLCRLLRAASFVRHKQEEPPFALEGRIVALWRNGAIHDRLSFDAMSIIRPALITAAALACITGALTFRALSTAPDPATRITTEAFLTAMN